MKSVQSKSKAPHLIASLVLILVSTLLAAGQGNHTYYTVSITGPSSVCTGGSEQFTYSSSVSSLEWTVTGGTIVGSNVGSSVLVSWTSTYGTISAASVEENCWYDPEIWPPVLYCDYTHYTSNVLAVSMQNTPQNVGGGGELCAVDPVSLVVTLDFSTPTCTYQLYRNGSTAVGSPVAGNLYSLIWEGINLPGTYTVVASCPSGVCAPISGAATVTQLAASVGGTVSGSASYYGSATGFSMTVSGHTGSVDRWEYSTGGDWSSIASTQTTLVYNSSITKTTSFRAVIRNGDYGCLVAYSSPATITIYPSAPTSLSASALTSGSFIANWSAVTGATSYRLDVSTSTSFATYLSGYQNLEVDSTSQSVSGIVPSTTYFYRVQAVNAYGPSLESNVTTQTTPALAAPLILNATGVKSDEFTANWSSVSNATSYRLDVSTNSAFSSFVTGYENKEVNGTSSAVTGLTNKTTYYTRVRSMSGSTPSANSTVSAAVNLDRNYLRAVAIQKAGVISESTIDGLPAADKVVSYSFFDGLGRPLQQVTQKQSVSPSDLVQPIGYDEFGRESIKYLPFTSGNNGWFKTDFLPIDNSNYATSVNPQYQFYQNTPKVATSTKPYSVANLESSPLNRLLEQGAPGLDFQPDATVTYSNTGDRTVKYAYLFNDPNEVLRWTYLPPSATYPLGMVSAGPSSSLQYYAINTLTKNKTKDEQYNEVIEYVDKSGKTILKRVQAGASTTVNDTNYASTYYVYDNLGQLVYVIPPEATKRLVTDFHDASVTAQNRFMARWAFRYKYDNRRRMVIKQVPGADSVRMVYDALDRLVFTQDGNQRPNKQWSYTKYDQLNRPIITGIYTHGTLATQAQMAALLVAGPFHEKYDGTAATEGYTNAVVPISGTVPLTVTYYDNYSFLPLWSGTWTYLNETLKDTTNGVITTQPTNAHAWVQGQATGTKVRALDGGATSTMTWLKSVSYYNERKVVIQTLSDNYKGGTDRVTSVVDFTGKVLKTKSTHFEQDVNWKDLVGTTVVGNKLDRTKSGTGWNAGAVSTTFLPANQAGWVEFTVTEITSNRTIGLASANPDAGISSMNYALNLNGSALTAYVSNTPTNISGTILVGDVLRIERTGTTIYFKKNGTNVGPTPTSSTSMLMVDVSIYNSGKTITGVRASFASSNLPITRKFEYDDMGRLVRVRHQYDTRPKVYLLANEYNELGQLVDKKLHSADNGSTYKQSVDYRYNIRGWLETINNSRLEINSATNDETNDLFGMELKYQTVDPDLTNPQFYNGNISGVRWSNYPGTGATKEKGYVYDYDAMNRIKSSQFRQRTSSWSTLDNNRFAENGFTYDLNGNLLTLVRNDGRTSGSMDNLSYNYGPGGGNRLKKVTDSQDSFTGFIDGANSANEYTYDSAGNMIGDLNKNLTITYNHLNLPEVVRRGNDTVRYVYDASGRKLWQGVIFDGGLKQTDYAGEFTYENDALQFVSHEEGRIVIATNSQTYLNRAESNTGFTAVNATLGTVTQNGSQTYLSVTSNGSTARTGVYPIGGTFTVSAGEKYRIRVKGYRTGASAAFIQVKASDNDIVWPGASLANGSASETWTEQLVVIPSGASTLKVGVNWNTVTTGEVMFINEVEITKLSSGTAEYQYHLKDHLGNVRMTFTASPPPASNFTAGFEAANQATESTKFSNYPAGGQINTQAINARTGTNSQLLNGGYNGQVGVAKSFAVMPGDQVSVQAYAKYGTPSGTPANYSGFVTALLSAFSLNAPLPGEAGTPSAGVNTFANWEIGTSGNTSQNDARKVFVTIILFDRNYNFLDVTYQASTSSGALISASYTVREPGYAYVYVSNEHTYLLDVYFDDVAVTITPSMVVGVNEYFPFGLPFNATSREGSLSQDLKFSGKETQTELELGWLDYGARMYQPEIGRWNGVDKSSEKYFGQSPYHFAGDNPILFVDYDGNDYGVSVNHDSKTITISAQYISNKANLNSLNSAIEVLNKQSGEFKYVVGSGKDAQVYSIIFNLSSATAEGGRGGDRSSRGYVSTGDDMVIADKTGELNSFDVVPNGLLKGDKGLTGNDKISIEERFKNTGTATHEILHTLGVSHETMSSENGGGRATKSMVGEILAGVGIGGKDNIARNAGNRIGDGSLRPETGKSPFGSYSSDAFTNRGGLMTQKKINRILSKVLKKE